MADVSGGWTNYGGSSRKWHYTDDPEGEGRSLCRKWARSPFTAGTPLNLEPDGKPSPDDCVACRRKLDKRKAAT
jgi:hypothetical protein